MITIEHHQLLNGEVWVFSAPSPGLIAIVAVGTSLAGEDRIMLASVRHVRDKAASAHKSPEHLGVALEQALTLDRKLARLDLLALSDISISESFFAGRLLVVSDANIPEADVWEFANLCLQTFRERVYPHLLTQPDYDQMHAHHFLIESRSSMELKTKHNPSASGTIATFQVILDAYLGRGTQVSWAIFGVGEIGRRITERLAKNPLNTIFAYDIDSRKLDPFRNSNRVKACSRNEWLNGNPDAVIFAANSGSLTETLAKALGRNNRLLVFGGPEAGLDAQYRSPNLLATKRIHFVSSFLCGGLGLVCNLSEVLGKSTSLKKGRRNLVAHTKRIVAGATESGRTFQDQFDNYIAALEKRRLLEGPRAETASLAQQAIL